MTERIYNIGFFLKLFPFPKRWHLEWFGCVNIKANTNNINAQYPILTKKILLFAFQIQSEESSVNEWRQKQNVWILCPGKVKKKEVPQSYAVNIIIFVCLPRAYKWFVYWGVVVDYYCTIEYLHNSYMCVYVCVARNNFYAWNGTKYNQMYNKQVNNALHGAGAIAETVGAKQITLWKTFFFSCLQYIHGLYHIIRVCW